MTPVDTSGTEIRHESCSVFGVVDGIASEGALKGIAQGKKIGRPKGSKNKAKVVVDGAGVGTGAGFVDGLGTVTVEDMGKWGKLVSVGGSAARVEAYDGRVAKTGTVPSAPLWERYLGPGGIPSNALADERTPFRGNKGGGINFHQWINRPMSEEEYARSALEKEVDKLEFLEDLGAAERKSWEADRGGSGLGSVGEADRVGGVGDGALWEWTDRERVLWGFPVACGDHWEAGMGLWGPLGAVGHGEVAGGVGAGAGAGLVDTSGSTGPVGSGTGSGFVPSVPYGWAIHRGNAHLHGGFDLLGTLQGVVDDTFAEFGLQGPVLSERESRALKGMLPVYSQAAFTEICGLPEDWYTIQVALAKSHNDCYPVEWFNDICALLEKMDNPNRKEALNWEGIIRQFQSDYCSIFVKNCYVKGGIGRRKLKKKPMLFFRVPNMQYGVMIKSTLRTEHCIVGHNTTIGIGVASQIDIYSWIQWFRCDIRTKLLSLYPEVSNGNWKPHPWLNPPNRIWWTEEENVQ